ncbi:MAG: lyase family protein, partial [Cyclobacteriaceae bacterium]|nr:lyase family protein [Cyclobacteriaceae bacterium]
MELSNLTAISPIDGRYRHQAEPFAPYFSEYGLIKYRIFVEIEYFIALVEMPLPQLATFNQHAFVHLREIYHNFTPEDALKIKETEKVTNHDVKAVEYYIKEKFDLYDLSQYKEFIHFGLTSQDINNTAVPLSLKEGIEKTWKPLLLEVVEKLDAYAETWNDVPMLAKTHGQPASPTRLGKEIAVFSERISQQLMLLETIPYAGKFGGATGNFNAHHVTYPKTDWVNFGNQFLKNYLGLHRSHPTTQIEHYDHLAALFDNIKRIHTILIDFTRDMWQYISMGYFKQKIKKGEIGSS